MVLRPCPFLPTHKPLLLPFSHGFLTLSSRPINIISPHLTLPLSFPLPTTTSTSIRFSPPLHPFTTLPRFLSLRPMAISDHGSGGRGDSGGSNSGDGGDGSAGGGGGEGEMLKFIWFFRSIMKKLEPINTLTSSVWCAIGFYLIVVGGQDLLEDFSHWLTVVFPAFDVFFIIFCIGMACIVFFILFCFIPLIALAYAKRIREGASEADIKLLPKYRFSQSNLLVIVDDKKHSRIHSNNGNHVSELSVHPDDSECCICLSPYVDGTELYRLPCTHHFHCGCISRWLRTKATCPLCKFNILR